MTTLNKIGLDPGFSSLKLGQVTKDNLNTLLYPSQVALPASLDSGLNLIVSNTRRGPRPNLVEWSGYSYLTGQNISHYSQPINRMDFNRFTDSPELRASLYASLHKFLGAGAHTLALALALPVQVLEDEKQAKRIEADIQKWMVGQHHYSVDNKSTTLTITQVKANIAQPIASWMDWGLDLTGVWVKGNEALKAPTLVIDEGFNTLDILVVGKGRIVHRHTEGQILGLRQAAQSLNEVLKRKYGLHLDLSEANELITATTPTITLNGENQSVKDEVNQALKSLQNQLYTQLEYIITHGRSYRVILTGGGVLALQNFFTTLFPDATVMYEPVLANARGIAKLVQRKGFLE